MTRVVIVGLLLTVFAFTEARAQSITVKAGAINSVLIERDGASLAIHAAPEHNEAVEYLLLTHHRRDVTGGAKDAAARGVKIVAPKSEQPLIESPGDFWNHFSTARFHDYAQQSTKVLTQPLAVSRWVDPGDTFVWKDIEFRVLETPGYTRGSVSYVALIGEQKVAFTGDLIHGDGQIFDLYSFQDEIPEANIRGYHGYGGRLAALVTSLQKIAAERPDLVIPARGPTITDPQAAIDKLVRRVRALYHNYLSTNALHWYFKEDRMRVCGERVLGSGANVELMPYSVHEQTPDWVFEQATSRLLVSEDGHGFLLDCGYQRVIDAVKKLMAMGLVRQIDGIFVTHYHDDHTDMVQTAAEEFNCPVYATVEYEDVLESPHAYHLPAMTSNAIVEVKGVPSGEQMKWREFDFTFHFYPGQTFYHGALLVQRKEERPIFFIGDSFAPSGLDDYCVLNRNLVREDSGYLLCLRKLRELPESPWLVNEHIPYVFEFSDDEMNYLERRYRERIDILRELFPWDDPNYGIDEQWVVFYPYGSHVEKEDQVALSVRLTNHSPAPRTFHVTPRLPEGMRLLESEAEVTLQPGASGAVGMLVQAPARAGNFIVTADIDSEGMALREWTEAIVQVK